MHITERLGLFTGCPASARESELLRVFEQVLIDADMLFLTTGPTITVASDFGNTVVGVRQADQGAWIEMVMVPDGLPAGLVKAVVAAASAEIEGDCRLMVVERQGQPLMLVSREYVTRPWRRDVLASIFHEFTGKTVMALAQAVTAEQHERDGIAVEVMAG